MKPERIIELALGLNFCITKQGIASLTKEHLTAFALAIRNETLEEAAKVCDELQVWLATPKVVATRIRSMKNEQT